MQYEGIDGDVTEKGHDKWILCHGMSFDASRPAQTEVGRAGERQGTGVSINDISISKPQDKASPHLFTESLQGLGKKVILHITRSGAGKPMNHLEITLGNCIITSFASSSQGDEAPTESLSLNFEQVELAYTPVKPDGSPGARIPVGFDIALGAETAAS